MPANETLPPREDGASSGGGRAGCQEQASRSSPYPIGESTDIGAPESDVVDVVVVFDCESTPALHVTVTNVSVEVHDVRVQTNSHDSGPVELAPGELLALDLFSNDFEPLGIADAPSSWRPPGFGIGAAPGLPGPTTAAAATKARVGGWGRVVS